MQRRNALLILCSLCVCVSAGCVENERAAPRGNAPGEQEVATNMENNATALDAAGTGLTAPDAGSELHDGIECLSAHVVVENRLTDSNPEAWDRCNTDTDCTWRPMSVRCPERGVNVSVCAHAIAAEHLDAANELGRMVTDQLCGEIPSGCKNTPGCLPRLLKCIEQRCEAVRVDADV